MFTTRDLALVAGFAGLYLGYGYVSSIAFRTVTRSLDLFFLIAALFAILASVIRKPWAATLLATVTGLSFLGTPAPFAPHITASLVANGFIFDLYLRSVGTVTGAPLGHHIVVAGTLGNFVMAGTGLMVLAAVGVALPASIWTIAIVGDTLVGTLGSLFGLTVVRRIREPPMRRC